MQHSCKIFFVFLVVIFLMTPISSSWAQVITETQRLNFGTWLISSNASNYSITVQPNGSYSNSPQLVMLSPPSPGVYSVTGLPPFATILSVVVVMSQPLEAPAAESFTMDNFQSIIPDANGAGNTTLTLGARANTSGNGNGYNDATYGGVLDVTINF